MIGSMPAVLVTSPAAPEAAQEGAHELLQLRNASMMLLTALLEGSNREAEERMLQLLDVHALERSAQACYEQLAAFDQWQRGEWPRAAAAEPSKGGFKGSTQPSARDGVWPLDAEGHALSRALLEDLGYSLFMLLAMLRDHSGGEPAEHGSGEHKGEPPPADAADGAHDGVHSKGVGEGRPSGSLSSLVCGRP